MKRPFETAVGALVLLLAGLFLFYGLVSRPGSGGSGYTLYADFSDASGLRIGTVVESAGVPIGRITSLTLGQDYFARVAVEIDAGITLPEGSQLAWRQASLIGAPTLAVLIEDPFSDPLEDGDVFSSVDPADNLFELLYALAGAGSAP